MARGQVSLNIAMIGKDRFSGMVRTANDSVKDLGRSGEQAGRRGASATQRWQSTVTALSTAFLAAQKAAQMLSRMGSAAFDTLAAGEEARNIDRIFRATQDGADQALAALRRAGDARFDDTALQAMANKWRLLGVNADKAAEIIKLGTQTARATMVDAESATKSFFVAVATGRETSLQRLGILADLRGAVEDYAAAHGRAVDQLTEFEKQQARIATLTQQVGQTFDDLPMDQLTNKTDRLTVRWDNFVSNMHVATLELAEGLRDTQDQIEAGTHAWQRAEPELRHYARALFFGGNATVLAAAEERRAQEARDALTESTRSARDELARMAAEQMRMGASADDVADRIEASAGAFVRMSGELDPLIAAIRLGGDGMAAFGRGVEAAVLQAAQADWAALQDQARSTATTFAELAVSVGRSLGDVATQAADVVTTGVGGELDRLAEERRKAAEQAAEAAEQQRKAAIGRQLELELARIEELKLIYAEEGPVRQAALDLQAEQARIRAETARGTTSVELAAIQERIAARRFELAEQRAVDEERLEQERELQERRLEQERRGREAAAALQRDLAKSAREAKRQMDAAAGSITRVAGALTQVDSSGVAGSFAASAGYVAKNFEDIRAAAPSAIAGLGQVASGFISNKVAQAAIAAAFETAAGFASLAMLDPVGAALHFTAAGLYATIGGIQAASGGGGSAAGASPSTAGPIRAPTAGGGVAGQSQQPAALPAGPSTVIYNYGPTVGTTQESAVQLALVGKFARGTGFDQHAGAL